MSELFVIGDGFGFVAKILIPKNCVYSFYTEITPFSMKNGTANKKKMIKREKKY